MYQGKTVEELAQEVVKQSERKKDFLAPTSELAMSPALLDNALTLKVGHEGLYTVTPHTHQQIATRLNIPWSYYNKMLETGNDLLSQNVNYWFNKLPERRMVRTLDGKARAFLSDRYRRLDNDDLMAAVMPFILEQSDLQIASCDITETRLYLKVVSARVVGEVKKGDPVQAGFVISNSEIGLGRLMIQQFINILRCLNGMVVATDYGIGKVHVGRNIETGEEVSRLFADETLLADDKAFWLKVRDVVRIMLSETNFANVIADLRRASEEKIEGDPVRGVELLGQTLGLNEGEKRNVLMQLIKGGDLTKYGVMNAVTAAAQDKTLTYDRASEIEALGGKVITLSDFEWKMVANA